ncbi:MAG: hypothetical protein H2174_02735 [Vampirovibrio sp.]|nr:hypothetical protein [Vampirovibrio sp.]
MSAQRWLQNPFANPSMWGGALMNFGNDVLIANTKKDATKLYIRSSSFYPGGLWEGTVPYQCDRLLGLENEHPIFRLLEPPPPPPKSAKKSWWQW